MEAALSLGSPEGPEAGRERGATLRSDPAPGEALGTGEARASAAAMRRPRHTSGERPAGSGRPPTPGPRARLHGAGDSVPHAQTATAQSRSPGARLAARHDPVHGATALPASGDS